MRKNIVISIRFSINIIQMSALVLSQRASQFSLALPKCVEAHQ